jgi:hypothetical protein
MKYKLLVLTILSLLLIGIVFAADVSTTKKEISTSKGEILSVGDKVIPYKEVWKDYAPVEIDSSSGLKEAIFKGAIINHTNNCSSDCASEMILYLANEGVLIEDISFLKKGNNEWFNYDFKNYDIKVKTGEETVNEDVYGWSNVGTAKNGSIQIGYIKVGTKQVVKEVYSDYKLGETVKAGTYQIKIDGKKNIWESLDWQIKTSGTWITDWAIWGGASPNLYANIANATVRTGGTYNDLGGFRIKVGAYNLTLTMVTQNDTQSTALICSNVSPSDSHLCNGVLATSTFVGVNATFNYNLTAGTEYWIVANGTEVQRWTDNVGGLSASPRTITVGGVNYLNLTGGKSVGAVYDPAREGYTIQYLAFNVSRSIGVVNLNSPSNGGTTNTFVDFNCSSTISGGADTLTNMSLYTNETGTWAARNTTTGLSGTNSTQVWRRTIANSGWVNWNCQACDNTGACGFSTNNYTVNVVNSTWSACEAGETPYLNLSFKDIDTNNFINASITSSTWTTSSGILTYSNTTESPYFLFCNKQGTNVSVTPFVIYTSTGYASATWNPGVQNYTNTTTNQTLYLLSTNAGIDVTFQVLNQNNQVQSGVLVIGNRTVSGVNTAIAEGTTDAAGAVTFFLNYNYLHTFTFTKEGYTNYTFNIVPTQSSYTVVLKSTSTVEPSCSRGVNYYVYPTSKQLFNNTQYNFAFNVSSYYWNTTTFGFSLRLANGTIVGTGLSVVNNTATSLLYNTINQSIIYMDYYLTNECGTISGTSKWIVSNTDNTGWSIKNFFSDLTLYLNSGIFGLDDFGRYLIVFLILFFTIGIMSYKYGFTSPMALSLMTFIVIFFFDFIVGLLPTINAIPHVLTYISGLVLVLTIIMEVRR